LRGRRDPRFGGDPDRVPLRREDGVAGRSSGRLPVAPVLSGDPLLAHHRHLSARSHRETSPPPTRLFERERSFSPTGPPWFRRADARQLNSEPRDGRMPSYPLRPPITANSKQSDWALTA